MLVATKDDSSLNQSSSISNLGSNIVRDSLSDTLHAFSPTLSRETQMDSNVRVKPAYVELADESMIGFFISTARHCEHNRKHKRLRSVDAQQPCGSLSFD